MNPENVGNGAEAVLTQLESGAHVTADGLAQQLHLTLEQVMAQVESLTQRGYRTETDSRGGIRLLPMFSPRRFPYRRMGRGAGGTTRNRRGDAFFHRAPGRQGCLIHTRTTGFQRDIHMFSTKMLLFFDFFHIGEQEPRYNGITALALMMETA